jgi:benzoyl-CoA reductase/2-hydroxyglutaryl-CoA dehydratase subunit BcrC/BadD/HgdB
MNRSPASSSAVGNMSAPHPPLIGYASAAVPREVLYAAGCRPFFLGNSSASVSAPSEFLESEFFGARSCKLLDEISAGTAQQFRAVVLSRTSEQEYKLFLYLRELERTSRIASTTEIHIFNLLQTAGDCAKAYGSRQVSQLLQTAKGWSGANSGDEALGAAIRAFNLARQALAEGLKLRSQSERATGCAVMALANAFYSLDPQAFCNYAKTWSADWGARPKLSGSRILLLGDIPSDGSLHSFVEAENAVVSVEDHWLGERAAVQTIDESADAMAAIAEHYMGCTVTPRHHSRPQSEAWLKDMLDRFDGAIFFYSQSDCVEGWDYPWQSHWLTEHKKPFVLLRDLSDVSKNTFQAFLEKLS